jgi:16S rRNA (guanine966-N2)-methyltransferase
LTRIVGGAAGGRLLRGPAGGTRPTSERTREALFNTLAGMVELNGARVLDLFAGTGAVGLEALSRGAATVVLVDKARPAEDVLRRNVDAVGLPGAVIRRQSADSYLAACLDTPFDLVFVDPPYDIDEAELAAVLDRLPAVLATGGVVVVERSVRAAAPPWPNVILPIKDRRYGDTVLWYGERS